MNSTACSCLPLIRWRRKFQPMFSKDWNAWPEPRIAWKGKLGLSNVFQESLHITRRTFGKRGLYFLRVKFIKKLRHGKKGLHFLLAGYKLGWVFFICWSRHCVEMRNKSLSKLWHVLSVAIYTSMAKDEFLSSLFWCEGSSNNWSKFPRYTPVCPEPRLSFFNHCSVHPGQELRLWYGEDLMNSVEYMAMEEESTLMFTLLRFEASWQAHFKLWDPDTFCSFVFILLAFYK